MKFDFREKKDLIRQIVRNQNEKDQNWKWSVKSISSQKVKIFWGYLEYMEAPDPCFTIVLEDTGDGWWIKAMNEHGGSIGMEILEDNDIPELAIDFDKGIKIMTGIIFGLANNCY